MQLLIIPNWHVGLLLDLLRPELRVFLLAAIPLQRIFYEHILVVIGDFGACDNYIEVERLIDKVFGFAVLLLVHLFG
jgi:hypothetical protein